MSSTKLTLESCSFQQLSVVIERADDIETVLTILAQDEMLESGLDQGTETQLKALITTLILNGNQDS